MLDSTTDKKLPKLIILVGLMGSGKTSVGKALAKHIHYDFIDTDRQIEKEVGKSITEIFAEDGEAAFRALEHSFALSLRGKENLVVATGGGLPIYHNNMDILNSLGCTVYLDVAVDIIASRIQHDTKRPLVKGKTGVELIESLQNLIDSRKQYYELAHVVLTTNATTSPYETAVELIEILSQRD